MRCHVPFLLVCCLGSQAPQVLAQQSSLDYALSVSLGPEYDSNARREVAEANVVQDGLLRGSVAADVQYIRDAHFITASTSAGAKVFTVERTENTAAALLTAAYRYSLTPHLFLGAEVYGRGRQMVDGDRNYESGTMDLTLAYSGLGPLFLEAHGGPRLFFYEPEPAYSSGGGGGGALARLRVLRHEQLSVTYDFSARVFPEAPVLIGIAPNQDRVFGKGSRTDLRHSAALRGISTRTVFTSAVYILQLNQSSNLGESFVRHRLQLLAGTDLPLNLFVSLTIGLQITTYPDGLALSEKLLLEDSDESQNKLVLTLKRPITDRLAIEGRLGLFSNELSDSGIAFARATTYLGLSYAY